MVRKKINKGPLMNAAEKALETGEARHILAWVPVESENTMKNLLERACCERTVKKRGSSLTADWYYRTVSHLHSVSYGQENIDITTKTEEEQKIIFLVESACESGNFEKITAAIPDTPAGDLRQRFNDILTKRKDGVETNADGRAYVSALTGLIVCAKNLHAGSLRVSEK